jgi:hypothetical protein
MASHLTDFNFPKDFVDFDLTRSQAETVIECTSEVISKAVKWFEQEYRTADVSARATKEVRLRKMMVSKGSMIMNDYWH